MSEFRLHTDDEVPEENSELYEHFRIVVDKGQALLRIDKFLMNRIENVSRNRIQQSAKAGNILANGTVVKPNYKVKPGDIVTVVFSFPPREVVIHPENIPLEVVYEDEHLIVINKQDNLVVHPAMEILTEHSSTHWPGILDVMGTILSRTHSDTWFIALTKTLQA